VVLFAFVLGAASLYQHDQVLQAEGARDDAAVEVTTLEGRVAELAPYQELADRLDARDATLAAAMAEEVSFASTLNEVALALPETASLESLSLDLADSGEPGEGDIHFGRSVASLSFSGYSVERYAPGVDAVLVDLDDVDEMFDVYLSVASEDEPDDGEGATSFNARSSLDDTARTHRYAEGLPEEVRP